MTFFLLFYCGAAGGQNGRRPNGRTPPRRVAHIVYNALLMRFSAKPCVRCGPNYCVENLKCHHRQTDTDRHAHKRKHTRTHAHAQTNTHAHKRAQTYTHAHACSRTSVAGAVCFGIPCELQLYTQAALCRTEIVKRFATEGDVYTDGRRRRHCWCSRFFSCEPG